MINFETFWPSTTENYKRTMLNKLLHFTKLETGSDVLDEIYQNLYDEYLK